MRLINTRTLKFREFSDKILPYAIFSHRWGDDEITFQDYKKGRNTESPGYKKVMKFVEKAAEDGFEWAWIDTCCVDKKSSEELSEAINSMFRWYQKADVCYAYLSDVHHTLDDTGSSTVLGFDNSEWFTRGWTLQELLAPADVKFLDCDWNTFGTKRAMAEKISAITGIHQEHLTELDLNYISVAEKMSWASERRTLRVEDTAYCLMGIFNINMPLLYGEGSRAFLRLQQEIVRVSDDMSIFAWDDVGSETLSMFARSPACFLDRGDIRLGVRSGPEADLSERLDTSYATTHKGLQIDAHLYKGSARNFKLPNYHGSLNGIRLLLLSCWKFETGIKYGSESFVCAVPIRDLYWKGTWSRVGKNVVFLDAETVLHDLERVQRETIYIHV